MCRPTARMVALSRVTCLATRSEAARLLWAAWRYARVDPGAMATRPTRFPSTSLRLFTFTRLPQSLWRSVRTTNAIERLHEEFKRRIKTQTVLPSADTAAMLFWAHAQGRWLAKSGHKVHRSAN
jgi:transposase-like protein